MNLNSKIALVKEHKTEVKGEYKVGPTRTPVKVVGVGPKALKILVFEASRFTKKPCWKDQFVNYAEDIPSQEMAQLLLDEMVNSISQTTL